MAVHELQSCGSGPLLCMAGYSTHWVQMNSISWAVPLPFADNQKHFIWEVSSLLFKLYLLVQSHHCLRCNIATVMAQCLELTCQGNLPKSAKMHNTNDQKVICINYIPNILGNFLGMLVNQEAFNCD